MQKKRLILIILCLSLVFGCSIKNDNSDTNSSEKIELNKRLEGLIRVWGFLKYYHNKVATGDIDWDEVLLNAVPAVKKAENFDNFNKEIEKVIEKAGKPDISNSGSNKNSKSKSDESFFDWMDDTSLFKSDIINELKSVKNSDKASSNHYVGYDSLGVPLFRNEKVYPLITFPNENMRLLSLARFWNIINYYYPYKEGMTQDWEDVLTEFIPRIMSVSSEMDYHLTMLEFVVHINDGHGFFSSTVAGSLFGLYRAPFELGYVENKTVVIQVFPDVMIPSDAIKVGDIITRCHGTDTDTYRNNIRKYVLGSNDVCIERNINRYLNCDNSDHMDLKIIRDGQEFDVSVSTIRTSDFNQQVHEADSHKIRWEILPGNIGYVNMGMLEIADVDMVMQQLMNTKAIIFDVRNYPRGAVYKICSYLLPEPVAFAKILVPDADNPGMFYFYSPMEMATEKSNPDFYKGRVVILFNEITQSHAEFTCMAFQTAPDCISIGSQTAGADGNTIRVSLVGGISASFSAVGVFYPDGRPTQRIGILPDITVNPTLKGIREGRDEVLEKALEIIQ